MKSEKLIIENHELKKELKYLKSKRRVFDLFLVYSAFIFIIIIMSIVMILRILRVL